MEPENVKKEMLEPIISFIQQNLQEGLEKRVFNYLLNHYFKKLDKESISSYCTPQEIARELGVPLPTIRKTLRSLNQKGITFYFESLTGNDICYLDPENSSQQFQDIFSSLTEVRVRNKELLKELFQNHNKKNPF